MSMTTQCPSCDTTFRVTPQQLQAQHGMVRCGRCATVFDGFKALATLPVAVVPETVATATTESAMVEPATAFSPAPPASTAALQVDATAAVADAAVGADATYGADEPEPVELAATDEAGDVSPGEPVAVESTATETASEATAASLPEPPPTVITDTKPPALAEPPPALVPRHRKRGWAVGAAALLLLLCAQLVYLNRGDIAAALPESRPLLAGWCKSLRCTVALPQQPRQISIEASDMQAADAANPGLIILTATLRNQASITLGYPALDVVLTNTHDHTVARRIFLPDEYLTDNRDSRAGMAPSVEITIRLNIDSGDLGAAGFRLELMAAPTT